MQIRHLVKLTDAQTAELKDMFGNLRKTPGGALMAKVWKYGVVVSPIGSQMVDAIQAVTGQTGVCKSALESLSRPAAPNIIKSLAEQDHTKTTTDKNISTQIQLSEGERYIGGIVAADGTTTHIILLPGDFKGTWKKSMNWAENQGGDLPNRVEQSLLYATTPEEFEPDWYWSNTEHKSESGWAWYQPFTNGSQYYYHKGDELRARAVRRLVI